MSPQCVEIGLGSGRVHPLQVGSIGHGNVIEAGCRGQASADDDGIGIDALDGFIAGSEQADIAFWVWGPASPLPCQVWLVPDLVSGDPSLVPRGKSGAETGEILVVVRRCHNDVIGVGIHPATSPGRFAVQPGDHAQPYALSLVDNPIGNAPIEPTFATSLDLTPGKHLLDPAKSGVTDELHVTLCYLGPPPKESLHAIVRRFYSDRLLRRRGRGGGRLCRFGGYLGRHRCRYCCRYHCGYLRGRYVCRCLSWDLCGWNLCRCRGLGVGRSRGTAQWSRGKCGLQGCGGGGGDCCYLGAIDQCHDDKHRGQDNASP